MCSSKKWVGGLAALFAVIVGVGLASQTKFGKDWGGWAWVQVEKVLGWADEQRSLDDEIKRLENEVKGLDLNKAKLKDRSFALKEDIKELRSEVEKQKASLRDLRTVMNQRKSALDEVRGTKVETVKVEGSEVKIEVVRQNLVRDTDRFEKGYADLQRKEHLLAKMESNLTKVTDGIGALDQTQRELASDIGELKAKLEEVRLDEAQKETGLADDELTQKLTYIRTGVKDIRTKVNVMAERSKENVASTEAVKDDGFTAKVAGDKAETKVEDFNKIDLGGNK
jgi:chromosome segregation ATPase